MHEKEVEKVVRFNHEFGYYLQVAKENSERKQISNWPDVISEKDASPEAADQGVDCSSKARTTRSSSARCLRGRA